MNMKMAVSLLAFATTHNSPFVLQSEYESSRQYRVRWGWVSTVRGIKLHISLLSVLDMPSDFQSIIDLTLQAFTYALLSSHFMIKIDHLSFGEEDLARTPRSSAGWT